MYDKYVLNESNEVTDRATTSRSVGLDRRTLLRLVAAGIAVPGAAATATASETFVDILSVDPSDYPNVLLNVSVDTAAGEDGLLTEEDFQVIENGIQKEIQSFEFGSTKSDIVFVFDDTGSMGGEIDAMKSEVRDLVEEMEAAGIDSRYGLVTFKDNVEVDLELTDDAAALQSKVDELRASGGGDFEEDNFDAIVRALDADFRADAQKVLVDITDALSHYRGDGSGVSDHTIDEVAEALVDSGVAYVAVSPGYDDENASKKTLSEMINGTWIDINDADFTVILEEIAELVVTAYVVEYVTDLLPGAAAPISVIVDDPEEGTGEVDDTVDVPSDIEGSRLPELIERKASMIDSVRATVRPALSADPDSIVPPALNPRFDVDEFDSRAESYLSDLEDGRSEFDDATIAQHVEALERLTTVETVTEEAAAAPLRDIGPNGSVVEKQAEATLDIAKTLSFEAVARGAGRAARSSLVRGIADDIVRGTLDQVDSMKRGFSSAGYGGVGYGGRGTGSTASDQRKTLDELDDEYRSEVVDRRDDENKEFIENGANGLVNGGLTVSDELLGAFDDITGDLKEFLVRLEYEKYLNGVVVGEATDILEGFAAYEPPTIDLSDVPESVDVPLSETGNDLVEGAVNDIADFIDDKTDATEGVDYLEELDYDREDDIEFGAIPNEIELPLLSELPEKIDLGDVPGVSEIQTLADHVADLTAISSTALGPTIDELVDQLEAKADDGVLDPQSAEAREALVDLSEAVISAAVEVSDALFSGLDSIAELIDWAEFGTAVLLIAGAVIGLAATGGVGAIPAIGVLGALSTLLMALSVVVDRATYIVGEEARSTFGHVHNGAGSLLTYSDLSAFDGGV